MKRSILFLSAVIFTVLFLNARGIQAFFVTSDGHETIGSDAQPHEAQYFAYVERTSGICGGVLIGRLYVLTSAQCVTDPDNEVTQVRLAYYSPTQGEIYLIIKAAYVIPAEGYTNGSASHDVALIKLHEPADLLPGKVALLPLPPSSKYPDQQDAYDGEDVKLYGFELEDTRPQPRHLQTLRARVVPYDQCGGAVGAERDALCVEGADGAFYGETGSPAVREGVVVGVRSRRGASEGGGGRINVYARVDYHSEWIRKEMYRPHQGVRSVL